MIWLNAQLLVFLWIWILINAFEDYFKFLILPLTTNPHSCSLHQILHKYPDPRPWFFLDCSRVQYSWNHLNPAMISFSRLFIFSFVCTYVNLFLCFICGSPYFATWSTFCYFFVQLNQCTMTTLETLRKSLLLRGGCYSKSSSTNLVG